MTYPANVTSLSRCVVRCALGCVAFILILILADIGLTKTASARQSCKPEPRIGVETHAIPDISKLFDEMDTRPYTSALSHIAEKAASAIHIRYYIEREPLLSLEDFSELDHMVSVLSKDDTPPPQIDIVSQLYRTGLNGIPRIIPMGDKEGSRYPHWLIDYDIEYSTDCKPISGYVKIIPSHLKPDDYVLRIYTFNSIDFHLPYFKMPNITKRFYFEYSDTITLNSSKFYPHGNGPKETTLLVREAYWNDWKLVCGVDIKEISGWGELIWHTPRSQDISKGVVLTSKKVGSAERVLEVTHRVTTRNFMKFSFDEMCDQKTVKITTTINSPGFCRYYNHRNRDVKYTARRSCYSTCYHSRPKYYSIDYTKSSWCND